MVFTVADRAGNELSAGPFAVLVDTSVPAPIITSLTALTTRSLFVTARATDALSGIKDYLFEVAQTNLFAPPVSTSPWVAESSYTFTDLVNSTTYFVRVRVRDNLLNVSATSQLDIVDDVIGGNGASTSTYGSVYCSTESVVPEMALQNNDVNMLKFTLATPVGANSEFYSLRVRRTGTVLAVEQSANPPKLYVAKALILNESGGQLAEASFQPGVSTTVISLAAAGNTELLTEAPKTFYLAFRMSADAQPGATVGVDSITASDFGLQFPSNPEGPFPTYIAPIPVSDGPNNLTLTAYNLAPPGVQPNTAGLNLLRLKAQTDTGTSIISSMTFRLLGSMSANHITGLTLWRDKDGNGSLETNLGGDEKLSSGNDGFTNGYSTLVLTAQISSRTFREAAVNLFLTANIGASAPQGTSFQIALSTHTDVHLENPLDWTTFSQLPILTSTCTVVQDNKLWVSTADTTPSQYYQGELYTVMRATLSVDIGYAQVDRVTIDRTGTAQDGDVEHVAVYLDQNPDEAPLNTLVDVLVGTAPFLSGRATVNISTVNIVQGVPQVLFVTYLISPGASAGRTLGGSMTNSSYFRAVNPLSVVSSTTPFPYQSRISSIAATVNELLFPLVQSAAPGAIDQGANEAAMLRFDLVSSRNNFSWLSLVVEKTGTALDSDVRNVRIYRDDGDKDFSASSDTAISDSSQAFSGGIVNIPLTVPQTITVSTQTYFVTLSVQPTAVPGRTLGVSISTTARFNVSAPNLVTSTAPFPFLGGPVDIKQYANTIAVSTLSIVPALGAVPGALDVGVIQLELRTNVSSAKWFELKVKGFIQKGNPFWVEELKLKVKEVLYKG